jgi:hypothetical protein
VEWLACTGVRQPFFKMAEERFCAGRRRIRLRGMGPGNAALIERADEIAAIDATIAAALGGSGQVLLLVAAGGSRCW